MQGTHETLAITASLSATGGLKFPWAVGSPGIWYKYIHDGEYTT
jgi:hypothetical protein